MEKQDGVKKVILSGMRATVRMEDGKSLDKEKITDAFGAHRLKLVSMEVVERPAPVAIFHMQASGVG